MTERTEEHDSTDPAGSVGEEAARLLEALQEWALRAQGGGAGCAEATAAAAAAAASTAHRVNEHLATGGEDCRYCPLCQLISAVRGTPPEVRAHLVAAGTSLMHAAAGLLHTPVPDPDGPRGDPVQRIDLDDDWEDD